MMKDDIDNSNFGLKLTIVSLSCSKKIYRRKWTRETTMGMCTTKYLIFQKCLSSSALFNRTILYIWQLLWQED